MKKLILLIFIGTSLQASAQNQFLGLKGGAMATDVLSKDFFDDTEYKIGYTAGITYDYFINENLSVGAELLYLQRGFEHTVIEKDRNEVVIAERTIDFDFEYFAVPLKVTYTMGSQFYGFASLGVMPSLLLKSSYQFPPQIVDETGFTVENTDDAPQFDVAGICEIGGGYNFQSRYLVYLSASYQYSATPLSNNKFFPESDVRHHGVAVMAGVKFTLNKQSETEGE